MCWIIKQLLCYLRRLLTRIILLAGHTIGRLADFITATTKNITEFWAKFGYGKCLIVPILVPLGGISGPFGLAMAILARNKPWLEQTKGTKKLWGGILDKNAI